MKNEKIIFSLLLFIICIFSISVVSAAEGSGDNLIGEDSNENIILETNLEETDVSVDNSVQDKLNENVLTSDNEKLILEDNLGSVDDESANEKSALKEGGTKSFTDLNRTINGNNASVIYLNDDYSYDPNTDSNFKNGIVLNRNLEIHGGDHTINGSNTAKVLCKIILILRLTYMVLFLQILIICYP